MLLTIVNFHKSVIFEGFVWILCLVIIGYFIFLIFDIFNVGYFETESCGSYLLKYFRWSLTKYFVPKDQHYLSTWRPETCSRLRHLIAIFKLWAAGCPRDSQFSLCCCSFVWSDIKHFTIELWNNKLLLSSCSNVQTRNLVKVRIRREKEEIAFIFPLIRFTTITRDHCFP